MSYRLGNVLLIKSDVPEEIVYQSTKAVMENLDFMATVHPAWKKVSKEGIINGFTIPLHPGLFAIIVKLACPALRNLRKVSAIKQHATRLIGRVAHLYWLDRILIP